MFTKTAIFPSPWIYFSIRPSVVSNLLNLRILNFSPILAVLSINTSEAFLPESSINSCSNKLSTSAGFFNTICFATASTKLLNSAFCATKSVSELTSTTAPTF